MSKDIINVHMKVLTDEHMVNNLDDTIRTLSGMEPDELCPLYMGKSGRLRAALFLSVETVEDYYRDELAILHAQLCNKIADEGLKERHGEEYLHIELLYEEALVDRTRLNNKYSNYLKRVKSIHDRLKGITFGDKSLPALGW